MRFETYVIFMFAITVAFYWMGYSPPAFIDSSPSSSPQTNENVFQIIFGNIINPSSLAVLSVITIVSIAALFAGFSAIYVIPLAIVAALLNFFVFPISFLYTTSAAGGLPDIIRIPLFLLFNFMYVLAITSFIVGGSR